MARCSAMTAETAIVALAEAYLKDAAFCVALFRQTFPYRDVLAAWRLGAVAQTGVADWGRYEMHGFGCTFFVGDQTIDVEFAGGGRVGFDACRLWRFARQNPAVWPQFRDLPEVQQALDDALDQRLIHPAGRPGFAGDGNPDLHELADLRSP